MHIERIAELDAFQEQLDSAESTRKTGRQANLRGKNTGLVMKRIAGAASPNGGGDNYGIIDGQSARFTNAQGKDFSVHSGSAVKTIIFGTYKEFATPEKPMEITIVGVRYSDCLKYGNPVGNNKRVSVKLSGLPKSTKTVLGQARIPAYLIEAKTVEERAAMEKLIEALSEEELDTMVLGPTRANLRAYITTGGNVEDGQ